MAAKGFVAPQVLGLRVRVNILGFNDVVLSVVGDVSCRQPGVYDDFIILKDLLARSSMMRIGVGFTYVR